MVALSADHGFLPWPRRQQRLRPKLLERLNAAVDAKLADRRHARSRYRLEGCSLWLDAPRWRRHRRPQPETRVDIVRSRLATTWKDVIAKTMGEGDHSPEARNSHTSPGAQGDLFVIPRFGVPLSATGSAPATAPRGSTTRMSR